jgi:hypothetical protein
MEITDKTKKIIIYYISRYIQEIAEALIAYSIYIYITNKTVDLYHNIKIALFIGLITLVLEEYNPAYTKSIKSGVIMSVVSKSLK